MEKEIVEKKLKESEGRYKIVFKNAGDGILVADAKTKKFIFTNNSMCILTGYSEEELLCLGVEDIHPPEDIAYVIEQFTAQIKGEISLAKDISVLTKDKKVIYCDVNSALTEMDGRKVLLGFFRDIT